LIFILLGPDPLGELKRSPRPPSRKKGGLLLRGGEVKGEGRGGEGKGEGRGPVANEAFFLKSASVNIHECDEVFLSDTVNSMTAYDAKTVAYRKT